MPLLRVGDSPALQAASLALKAADRDLARTINRATVKALTPLWREGLAAHAQTDVDRRVLVAGARVKAGNPPVAVAATGKPLSGGLDPRRDWPVIEFGAIARNKVTTYSTTSRRGRRYSATRHASRQLPAHVKSGRVVYATLAEVTPKIVSVWVGIVYGKYRDAFGGGK